MHETPNTPTPPTRNDALVADIESFDVATEACPHCDGSGTQLEARSAGALIRDAREARRVSRQDFAEALGFSASYVSDLEAGRRSWSRELFARAVATLEALTTTTEVSS